MSDKKPKIKVNWTLDQDVVENVRQKAQQLTEENGIDVSVSAAANVMLRQQKSLEEEIAAIKQDSAIKEKGREKSKR